MHALRLMDEVPEMRDVDLVGSVAAYVKQEFKNAAVTIQTSSCEAADSHVEPLLTQLVLFRDRLRGMCAMMVGVATTLDEKSSTACEPVDHDCKAILALDSVVEVGLEYEFQLTNTLRSVPCIVDVNNASKQCLEAALMDVIASLKYLADAARALIGSTERHDQRVRRATGKSAVSLAARALEEGQSGVAKYEAVRALTSKKAFSREGALARVRLIRSR